MQYMLFTMTPWIFSLRFPCTWPEYKIRTDSKCLCIFCYINYWKGTHCFAVDFHQKIQNMTKLYVLLKSQTKFFILHYILKHDLRENSNREKLWILSDVPSSVRKEGNLRTHTDNSGLVASHHTQGFINLFLLFIYSSEKYALTIPVPHLFPFHWTNW